VTISCVDEGLGGSEMEEDPSKRNYGYLYIEIPE